jgi:hypothetical protein
VSANPISPSNFEGVHREAGRGSLYQNKNTMPEGRGSLYKKCRKMKSIKHIEIKGVHIFLDLQYNFAFAIRLIQNNFVLISFH